MNIIVTISPLDHVCMCVRVYSWLVMLWDCYSNNRVDHFAPRRDQEIVIRREIIHVSALPSFMQDQCIVDDQSNSGIRSFHKINTIPSSARRSLVYTHSNVCTAL